MIVFDLACAGGHRFEGWFASSDAFAEQQSHGLVECPQCGSVEVIKAPMAPAVPAKGNSDSDVSLSQQFATRIPPEVDKAIRALAQAQAKALEKSTWVGTEFAEQSRAMHYGERDQIAIHGQATPEEARALLEEGVSVAPLPFPVASPEDIN